MYKNYYLKDVWKKERRRAWYQKYLKKCYLRDWAQIVEEEKINFGVYFV